MISKKLENKVVIVTGSSKGIGAGIAKKMGAAGAKVVVNYATSKDSADAVVKEIVQAGGNAISIQGNMSNGLDVKRVFEETVKAYGSLDVLVNNAGIYEFALLEVSNSALGSPLPEYIKTTIAPFLFASLSCHTVCGFYFF